MLALVYIITTTYIHQLLTHCMSTTTSIRANLFSIESERDFAEVNILIQESDWSSNVHGSVAIDLLYTNQKNRFIHMCIIQIG